MSGRGGEPGRATLGAMVLALLVCAAGAPAYSQPGEPASSDPLERAGAAFDAGDWKLAEIAARGALAGQLEREGRAEAWRILGLSLFYLARPSEADVALLEYLKLDPDAELDPALHPPDAVVFLANVRSRYRAELDRVRPRGEQRRFVLTLAPPFGQFQNKQSTKAWVIGGVGLGLGAASIGSFLVLRSWCDGQTNVCDGHEDDAKALQVVNIGITLALLGTYAYGVVDAVRHYKKWKREQSSLRGSLSGYFVPTHDGAAAGLSFRF